jgi:hypothetical protein
MSAYMLRLLCSYSREGRRHTVEERGVGLGAVLSTSVVVAGAVAGGESGTAVRLVRKGLGFGWLPSESQNKLKSARAAVSAPGELGRRCPDQDDVRELDGDLGPLNGGATASRSYVRQLG